MFCVFAPVSWAQRCQISITVVSVLPELRKKFVGKFRFLYFEASCRLRDVLSLPITRTNFLRLDFVTTHSTFFSEHNAASLTLLGFYFCKINALFVCNMYLYFKAKQLWFLLL